MASRGKKKTTMAKLNRESKLRERRLDKQARKDQRKLAPPDLSQPLDPREPEEDDPSLPPDHRPAVTLQ